MMKMTKPLSSSSSSSSSSLNNESTSSHQQAQYNHHDHLSPRRRRRQNPVNNNQSSLLFGDHDDVVDDYCNYSSTGALSTQEEGNNNDKNNDNSNNHSADRREHHDSHKQDHPLHQTSGSKKQVYQHHTKMIQKKCFDIGYIGMALLILVVTTAVGILTLRSIVDLEHELLQGHDESNKHVKDLNVSFCRIFVLLPSTPTLEQSNDGTLAQRTSSCYRSSTTLTSNQNTNIIHQETQRTAVYVHDHGHVDNLDYFYKPKLGEIWETWHINQDMCIPMEPTWQSNVHVNCNTFHELPLHYYNDNKELIIEQRRRRRRQQRRTKQLPPSSRDPTTTNYNNNTAKRIKTFRTTNDDTSTSTSQFLAEGSRRQTWKVALLNTKQWGGNESNNEDIITTTTNNKYNKNKNHHVVAMKLVRLIDEGFSEYFMDMHQTDALITEHFHDKAPKYGTEIYGYCGQSTLQQFMKNTNMNIYLTSKRKLGYIISIKEQLQLALEMVRAVVALQTMDHQNMNIITIMEGRDNDNNSVRHNNTINVTAVHKDLHLQNFAIVETETPYSDDDLVGISSFRGVKLFDFNQGERILWNTTRQGPCDFAFPKERGAWRYAPLEEWEERHLTYKVENYYLGSSLYFILSKAFHKVYDDIYRKLHDDIPVMKAVYERLQSGLQPALPKNYNDLLQNSTSSEEEREALESLRNVTYGLMAIQPEDRLETWDAETMLQNALLKLTDT